MKIIFRIILILLVAALVAGGYSLAFGSSGTGSNFSGQAPVFGTNNSQRLARPEGGERDGGASGAGLLGIFVTLIKLAGIVGLVLALQKGLSLLLNRKTRATVTA